jgi:hypothetical protein
MSPEPANTSNLETAEHQEWRSRQHLDMSAVIKATAGVGLIFFYMSGGSPWSTAGVMNMIMGRDFPIGFWGTLVGHFIVALIYTFVIGSVIYRLPTAAAIPSGILTGIALYAVNWLIFRSAGLTMFSPEYVTFFVHVMFSLFVSLAYKALSVPPPLRNHGRL